MKTVLIHAFWIVFKHKSNDFIIFRKNIILHILSINEKMCFVNDSNFDVNQHNILCFYVKICH